MGKVDFYIDKAKELAIDFGPKVLAALLTLIVGLWIIGGLSKVFRRSLGTAKVDDTLQPFLTNLFTWILKVLLLVSVASMVGIETTSFVAVLGAAGLAVGLALQGSLANFAGGVLILIFRPYRVGDLVEAQGHLGVVQEIQIFCTVLTTPDNKRVILPNGAVSNGSITNFTVEGKLRVDLSVGVAYDADLKQSKEVIEKAIATVSNVLSEPAPSVAISELADSSVNFFVRPWATPADYWQVYSDTLTAVKQGLDQAGISIPFPQREIYVHQA